MSVAERRPGAGEPGTRPGGDRPPPAGLECREQLDAGRQIELRVVFGHYLDRLPPSCSLEEKTLRFARWLAERGVHYPT